MKTTKYTLLIIGLLGITASIYNYIQGDTFFDVLLGLVTSASLIYGYFYYADFEKKKEK
ncbi:hypothetical protein O3Q51_12870 [Cryomorphaceae bacterium 1068]|nr:hypothetical protein [Cryomorphaceae bacterium 1068]